MPSGIYLRTEYHGQRIKENHPHLNGDRHPSYKDGRCLKKYLCECGKQISISAGIYGKGKCKKCSREGIKFSEQHKQKMRENHADFNGEKNPMYGKKRPLHSINMQLENNPNWRGGKSFEPYIIGWTKTFKEQIRYRDGYKCQICGMPEIECKRKLDVHHIDYNKKNISIENLISLCVFCHMKTNFNREYWRNYFNEKFARVL